MDKVLTDRKVIVFQLGEEEYAVDVKQVGSIERVLPITRVPKTPSYVKGVINLRGVVTPIIDLRLRFGMGEGEIGEASRILIVNVDQMDVGLIVDAANDVIDIPLEKIESAGEVIDSANIDYIEGVAKLGSRLLILLDLHKVLEKDKVQLQAMEG